MYIKRREEENKRRRGEEEKRRIEKLLGLAQLSPLSFPSRLFYYPLIVVKS